jgi:hypothetical protein
MLEIGICSQLGVQYPVRTVSLLLAKNELQLHVLDLDVEARLLEDLLSLS